MVRLKNKSKDLGSYFEEYLLESRAKNLRDKTIGGYKLHYKTFSKIMPEIKYPEQITPAVWGEFVYKLKNRDRIVGKGEKRKGVKDSTIRTYWNKLNSFCNWLVNNDIIRKNPIKDVRPIYPTYKDKKSLEKEEILKIYGSLMFTYTNSFLRARDKAIFCIMLLAGLRKGEVLGLRITDVDLKNNILKINGQTSKSREDRMLPINPELQDALKDWIEERNKKKCKTEKLFVSISRDQGITEHGFKHLIDKIKELSGVEFHAHRLRHTFACKLAEQNMGSIMIQKAMGHSDPRMTERYLRSLGVEELREGVYSIRLDR